MQPDLLYVGTVAAIGMLHGMVRTIAPLYAVQAAGLQPLELALAGTLLELGVFLGAGAQAGPGRGQADRPGGIAVMRDGESPDARASSCQRCSRSAAVTGPRSASALTRG